MIGVPTFTGMGECVSINFPKKDAVVDITICSNFNGVVFISRNVQAHSHVMATHGMSRGSIHLELLRPLC